MARIYLVRHGQTLFNLQFKTQGQCDSPLTSEGIEMAKKLGGYLRDNNIKFDHGFCSTSERAEDTLNYITNNSLPYTRLKSLKEMNFGTHEGGSDKELWGNNVYAELEDLDKVLEPYGAEKIDNVIRRMIVSMNTIASSGYENILVVSHGLIIFIWMHYLGKEFADKMKSLTNGDDIFLKNCDCAVFEIENGKIELVDYINYESIAEGDKNA